MEHKLDQVVHATIAETAPIIDMQADLRDGREIQASRKTSLELASGINSINRIDRPNTALVRATPES